VLTPGQAGDSAQFAKIEVWRGPAMNSDKKPESYPAVHGPLPTGRDVTYGRAFSSM
jgi:hypothetical protein